MRRLTLVKQLFMGFTKLFSDIVCSSIWNEDDKTRLVWVTLLAIKGPNHVARCTIGGLAHQARVSVEDCQRAIEKLTHPDPDGMDQPEEGRRIRAVEHGWLVLNGEAYKLRRDDDDRREYQRVYHQEYRRKQSVNNRKQPSTFVNGVNPSDQIRSEADQIIGQREEGFALSASPSPSKSQKFEKKPKSWDEFLAFCEKNDIGRSDAEYLYNHWQANGWMIGKQEIKSWKHAVRTWKSGGYLPSQKPK